MGLLISAFVFHEAVMISMLGETKTEKLVKFLKLLYGLL